MRAILWVPAALLALGAAPALASVGVQEGAAHAEIASDGAPVDVAYSGLETPAQTGDDRLAVVGGIRSVGAGADAPIAPVEEHVELADPELQQPGFVLADEVLGAAYGASPAVPERARVWFAPEGIYLHWDLAPTASLRRPPIASNDSAGPLLWPRDDNTTGLESTAGYDYESVYLHPGLQNGTGAYVDEALWAAGFCWVPDYTEQLLGQPCVSTRMLPIPLGAARSVVPSADVSFHVERLGLYLLVGGDGADSPRSAAGLGAQDASADGAAGLAGIDFPAGGVTLPGSDAGFGAAASALQGNEASGDSGMIDGLVAALPALFRIAVALPPAWYLYHRLERGEILRNPKRASILAQVQAQPGISQQELARALGMQHTLVDYHTRHLVNHGIVTQRRIGGNKCFFPGTVRGNTADVLRNLLQRGRTRDVLEDVAANPRTTLSALAGRVGMTVSSAHWHIARLQGFGLIASAREGRMVRLSVPPEQLAAACDVLPALTLQPAPVQAAEPSLTSEDEEATPMLLPPP